ncbi:aminotransferase class III-fold pyridoxal phosphate-dependent enzyme [Thalassotalea fusca]
MNSLHMSFISAEQGSLIASNGQSFTDVSRFQFGYQEPSVVQAVAEQLRIGGLSSRSLMSRSQLDLTEYLAHITPPQLTMSYLCNSPDEAFEGAIKLLRGYHKSRRELVVITGGRFGHMTYGRGLSAPAKEVEAVMHYKVRWVDRAQLSSLSSLSEVVTKQTAAIIVNPLAHEYGLSLLTIAQANHINQARATSGALTIVCENETFGRGESWFASEKIGLEADVVTYGNVLGGGVLPIGAYTTRRDINEAVYGKKNPSLHGSTTGGNPASVAAAAEAIRLLSAIRLKQKTREFEQINTMLEPELTRVASRYRAHYGSVLGAIFMTGLTPDEAHTLKLTCEQHGLIIRQEKTVICLIPPITMSSKGWKHALQLFSDVATQSPQLVINPPRKVQNEQLCAAV